MCHAGPGLWVVLTEMKVPRKIHMIWVSGPDVKHEDRVVDESGLKPKYRANLQAWKDLNPEFEVKLWTDDSANEFLDQFMKESPRGKVWARSFRDLKNPAAKADVLRYAIMDKEGGYYVDTDTVPHKPLVLMEKKYADSPQPVIFASSRDILGRPLATNSFIVSEPDAKFWHDLSAEVGKRTRKMKRNGESAAGIMYGTGPQMLIPMIDRNPDLVRKADLVDSNGHCGQCEMQLGTCDTSAGIYSHTYDGSWTDMVKFRDWWCSHGDVVYKGLVIALVVIGAAILFFARSGKWPRASGRVVALLFLAVLMIGAIFMFVVPMLIQRDDYDNYQGAMMSNRLNEMSDIVAVSATLLFVAGGIGWIRTRLGGDVRLFALLMFLGAEYLILKSTWEQPGLHFAITIAMIVTMVLFVHITPVYIPWYGYALTLLPVLIALTTNKIVFKSLSTKEDTVSSTAWWMYYWAQLVIPIAFIVWALYVHKMLQPY